MRNFARCNCHPDVCNKLATVHEARYPLMICCSLSSTLSSVEHILQDANREAQNHTCKQSLRDLSTVVVEDHIWKQALAEKPEI